jgi:hypothetical protein
MAEGGALEATTALSTSTHLSTPVFFGGGGGFTAPILIVGSRMGTGAQNSLLHRG